MKIKDISGEGLLLDPYMKWEQERRKELITPCIQEERRQGQRRQGDSLRIPGQSQQGEASAQRPLSSLQEGSWGSAANQGTPPRGQGLWSRENQVREANHTVLRAFPIPIPAQGMGRLQTQGAGTWGYSGAVLSQGQEPLTFPNLPCAHTWGLHSAPWLHLWTGPCKKTQTP